jgi:hypothetical protein
MKVPRLPGSPGRCPSRVWWGSAPPSSSKCSTAPRWIAWYNQRRLHSATDYLSPLAA